MEKKDQFGDQGFRVLSWKKAFIVEPDIFPPPQSKRRFIHFFVRFSYSGKMSYVYSP